MTFREETLDLTCLDKRARKLLNNYRIVRWICSDSDLIHVKLFDDQDKQIFTFDLLPNSLISFDQCIVQVIELAIAHAERARERREALDHYQPIKGCDPVLP